MIKLELIIPLGLFYMSYNILINNEFWGRGGGYVKFETTYISIFFGIFLLISGIGYLYYMNLNKKKTTIQHSICPTCQESYNYIDLKEGLCPDCNIKTVDIKEYYQDKKDEEKI